MCGKSLQHKVIEVFWTLVARSGTGCGSGSGGLQKLPRLGVCTQSIQNVKIWAKSSVSKRNGLVLQYLILFSRYCDLG